MRSTNLRYWMAALGLMLGLAGQTATFAVSISEQLGDGKTFGPAVLHYFGFLTNLTNIWLLAVYAAVLVPIWWLRPFRGERMQTSAAATILLVMLFYHFILKPTYAPAEGIDYWTDMSNHYVAPLVYLGWWLSGAPYRDLRITSMPAIMLPAVLYPAYVLARGLVLNEYPYAVIDVNTHGYSHVLVYMLQVVVGFAVLCAVALAVNFLFARLRRQPSKASS